MTATHAPDCDGEDAPWCSTACVAAVDAEAIALHLGLSERTVRRHCRPVRYNERGKALYDPFACADTLAGVTGRKRRRAA